MLRDRLDSDPSSRIVAVLVVRFEESAVFPVHLEPSGLIMDIPQDGFAVRVEDCGWSRYQCPIRCG